MVSNRSFPYALKSRPKIINKDNRSVPLPERRCAHALAVGVQLQQPKLDEDEQRADDNDADGDEPPRDLEDDPPHDEHDKHPDKGDQQLREAQPGDPAGSEPADKCK